LTPAVDERIPAFVSSPAAVEFRSRRPPAVANDDADEAALLAVRERVGLRILVFGLGAFLAVEWLFRERNLAALALVRLVQITALIGVWALLERSASRRRIVFLGQLAIACLVGGQALAGIVADDLMTSTLVAMALAISTAALIPWGVPAQLCTVAATLVSLLANATRVSERPRDFGFAVVAILLASVASLYVAFEVRRNERQRRAAERELDDLRRMEQSLAERAAREREEKLVEARRTVEKMADATPHILYLFDAHERTVVYVNRQVTHILGYSTEQVLREGLSFLIGVIHPDDLARTIVSARENLADVPANGVVEVELRARNAAGEWRWIHSRNVVFTRSSSGEALQILGTAQDISERMHADERARAHEAELAHELRVSSLGEMTAGLAHELNQPLSSIVSFARGCVRRLDSGRAEPAAFRDVLDQIGSEALRAGAIIRRLRSLVRQEEPVREPTDADELVRGVATLLQPEARRLASRIELQLAGDLPRLSVDRIQIEQVLMNLARNGLDAMRDTAPSHRVLTLRTSRADDGTVQIEVHDRGHGFGEIDPERIFEPFFTTKDTGLGMGLSISRSIARAHAGRLTSRANHDAGATFVLALPVTAAADAEHGASAAAPPVETAG
jgi:PAS domain S-box-containing protein